MPLDRLDPAQLLSLCIVVVVFASIVGLVLGIVGTVTAGERQRRTLAAEMMRELLADGLSPSDVRSLLRAGGLGGAASRVPDWRITTTTTVSEDDPNHGTPARTGGSTGERACTDSD